MPRANAASATVGSKEEKELGKHGEKGLLNHGMDQNCTTGCLVAISCRLFGGSEESKR